MPRKRPPKAFPQRSVWLDQELDGLLDRLGAPEGSPERAKLTRNAEKFVAKVRARGGDMAALDAILDEREAKRKIRDEADRAERERREEAERQRMAEKQAAARAERPAPARKRPERPETPSEPVKRRRRRLPVGSVGYRLPGGAFIDSRLYDEDD